MEHILFCLQLMDIWGVHSLALMYNATVTTHVRIGAWTCFISRGYVPSGTAWSQKKSMFNYPRNCQRVCTAASLLTFQWPDFFTYCGIRRHFSILSLFLLLFWFSPFPLNFQFYWPETLHYVPLLFSVDSVWCSPEKDTCEPPPCGLLSISKTFFTETGLFISNACLFFILLISVLLLYSFLGLAKLFSFSPLWQMLSRHCWNLVSILANRPRVDRRVQLKRSHITRPGVRRRAGRLLRVVKAWR